MYTRMRCQWKSESSELSGWWLWAWSWELGAELRSCKTNVHSWPPLRHNSLPSFPCSMWTGVLPGCRCAWSSLRSQGGIRSPWTDVKASREPLRGPESWLSPGKHQVFPTAFQLSAPSPTLFYCCCCVDLKVECVSGFMQCPTQDRGVYCLLYLLCVFSDYWFL